MRKILTILACILGLFMLEAKVYYVSKTGSDRNAGSESAPFLTISKAAERMIYSDICYISEGIYRETITPAYNGQTFKAMDGHQVEVSGFDVVDEWRLMRDNIYVALLSKQLDDRNQLLFNGQLMTLARWPNKTDLNPFNPEANKAWGDDTHVEYGNIPDQNWADGGVIWYLGKNRWTSWRQHITDFNTNEVNFSQLPADWSYNGAHSPSDGGEFFLQNTLEALDAEGEWYVNRAGKTIYFYAPYGADPNLGETLAKARVTAFNLDGKKEIVLEGLKITGANVTMNNSDGCTIRSCEILYGNHNISSTGSAMTSEASVILNNSSKNNLIEKCNIQWGAGNGIILKGTGNTVRNNYIGNFNYIGSYACPVELRGENDLVYNEIFNGGRDAIRGGGNGSNCAYNNIHHSNLINDDCGGIYICCGTYGYTRIHHNWIHDINSRDGHFSKYKGTGVYLDNSTKNVVVDHNVMWNLEWTGIQINWEGENLLLYNNTLWSDSRANSGAMGRWVNGYDIINIPLYNTLSNKGEYHSTDQKNTVEVSLGQQDIFEDFSAQDFMPKAGSPAIDAGRVIAGYTDGYKGTAPDAGAYEYGGNAWKPGPDWELNEGGEMNTLSFDTSVTDSLKTHTKIQIPIAYNTDESAYIMLQLLSGNTVLASQKRDIYPGDFKAYINLEFDEMPEVGTECTLNAVLYNESNQLLKSISEDIVIAEPIAVESIVLYPLGTQNLNVGDAIPFTYAPKPASAPLTVEWSSSDMMVAYMSSDDVLYAVSPGTCVVTAQAPNGVKAHIIVKVSGSAALDESSSAMFDIYPNPVNSTLFFRTEKEVNEVSIFDEFGVLLSKDEKVRSLDFSNFTAGIYFVDALLHSGERYVKRIVKR